MIQLLLTRASAKVYFVTEESFYNKVVEELEPYINVTRVDKIDPTSWVVYSDDYDGKVDEFYSIFEEQREEEPDRRVCYKEGEKCFIILQNEDAWKFMNSIRMIRNLIRWQLHDEGYCYLHGGLVNVKGTGVAFIGGKKSGKTSSILSFLRMKDVDYVTNDDLMLKMDDSLTALGWPRAVGIRNDTHQYIPQLKELGERAYGSFAHPANLYMNANKEKDYTTLYFKPKEVCGVFGKKIATHTKLKYIIFPCFSDEKEVSLEKLSREDAYQLLKQNIEGVPDKHDTFLKDFFPVPNIDSAQKFAYSMIEQEKVQCFRMIQSLSELEKASFMVRELIENYD